MEPIKNLKDYIKIIEERDNMKALTDEELEDLKLFIDQEQVRRKVIDHIQKLAQMLK